jgi:hypothetical protein
MENLLKTLYSEVIRIRIEALDHYSDLSSNSDSITLLKKVIKTGTGIQLSKSGILAARHT